MKRLRYKVILASSILVTIAIAGYRTHRAQFDQERWLKDPESWKYMYEDLLRSRLLTGMTKAQVVETLSAECKYCTTESDEWLYYVDIQNGMPNYTVKGFTVFFAEDTVTRTEILSSR